MSTHYNDVREYWNFGPCNIRHSSLPVGSLRYFEEVKKRRYFVEAHIPGFAEFDRWSGRSVLDLGCGIGTDAIEFALHGARVTAVDLSAASLSLTEERANIYRVNHRVTPIYGNIENLPCSVTGPFDLIYAFGSVHHTPNPRVALNEIRRICQPHTTVKLMLYHALSTKALALRLRHGPSARQFSEAQADCPVTHWYTKKEGIALLEDARFIVTDCRIAHIFPYLVREYRQHRYVRRFPWNFIQGRSFAWLERHFGWHLLIEARPK